MRFQPLPIVKHLQNNPQDVFYLDADIVVVGDLQGACVGNPQFQIHDLLIQDDTELNNKWQGVCAGQLFVKKHTGKPVAFPVCL